MIQTSIGENVHDKLVKREQTKQKAKEVPEGGNIAPSIGSIRDRDCQQMWSFVTHHRTQGESQHIFIIFSLFFFPN